MDEAGFWERKRRDRCGYGGCEIEWLAERRRWIGMGEQRSEEEEKRGMKESSVRPVCSVGQVGERSQSLIVPAAHFRLQQLLLLLLLKLCPFHC